ncbi:MAG: hypothetical protein KC486_26145 [Myxococcales bacterium]|nr:hypothetical protein [Myxococcales bacterium]
MPMLADLDDPPRSRLPGFLTGAAIGLPFVGLIAWLILPGLTGAVLGGAQDFDERLRKEDAYMDAVCGEAFDIKRDERLCGCVWVAEFPSLDCQHRFLRWRIDRAVESCADEATRKGALSFCSCVDVVSERVAEAEAAAAATAGVDPAAAPKDPASDPVGDASRPELTKFENCLGLDDALEPPAIETLAPGAPQGE